MTILLARWEGDQLRPWAEHENPRHAWAYSSVKIAERLIAQRVPDSDPVRERAIQEAEAALPDKGKWSVMLILTGGEGGWIGTALPAAEKHRPGKPLRWRYDAQRGLEQTESAEQREQEQE